VALLYPGPNPSNVSKDAKYSVVSGPADGMVVRLVYRVSDRERELLTTEHHDRLVEMVNLVKIELSGQAGGAFYINEHFDVLVPSQTGDGCYYAGTYERLLQFEFEGGLISPHPPSDLRPGDPWPGPHVGIKYTLAAGGNDIYYRRMTTPTRREDCRLSDCNSPSRAAELANRLATIKGREGGAIYINEAGEFFAPISIDGNLTYLYLGPLAESAWFPAPDVPRP
jgi:hypothetical protein